MIFFIFFINTFIQLLFINLMKTSSIYSVKFIKVSLISYSPNNPEFNIYINIYHRKVSKTYHRLYEKIKQQNCFQYC